ncbi:Cell division trigger factor [Helicobacter heilmannii]|uniref:trigger factor n=1 Tax=Helicobacter heilmannii TaxID=35817 RepID=UPI0006A14914|nr:trigger factor [Helicobacter heilmannii]CRF47452.1 Cell division trigger factor [Helicobacter heilmannii]
MDLTTKRLDSANASISAKPSVQDFEKKSHSIAQKIAKNTKLDGFRKGKVPLDIIKQRYQGHIQQESEKELLDAILQEGSKALEITPQDMIGNPTVRKFDKQAEHFDIEINIGLRPQIDLSGVLECVPSFSLEEVQESAIEERLQHLAKERATFTDALKDKAAANGDGVIFDFEGLLDNQPFEGNRAQNFALVVGEGRLLPSFEKQLVGMKMGDEKYFSVTFPKDYANATLAGKEVSFHVKLHKIQLRQIPEIDEAFVKMVLNQEKEPTLEMLKERVKDQLFLEAKTKLYNQQLKETLIDKLDKNLAFDLPETIIEQEMDLAFRQSLQNMKQEDLKELQDDPKKVKKKRDSFREQARRSVKVTFIIDALARQENIQVADNEVYQAVYYEALMANQNPQQLLEVYQRNNMLPAVKMAMVEDRVLTFLLDKQLPQEANA